MFALWERPQRHDRRAGRAVSVAATGGRAPGRRYRQITRVAERLGPRFKDGGDNHTDYHDDANDDLSHRPHRRIIVTVRMIRAPASMNPMFGSVTLSRLTAHP